MFVSVRELAFEDDVRVVIATAGHGKGVLLDECIERRM